MNHTLPAMLVMGVAIPPQSLNAGATLNGSRIITPGTTGRKIGFLVACSALTGVTALTIGVQYSQNGGTTWTNYLQQDGVTPMTFTATKTVAGGQLDGGSLFGSLELSRANHGDYRLVVSQLTGGNVASISAMYVLADPYRAPMQDPAVNDDLLPKQLIALAPAGGTPQNFG